MRTLVVLLALSVAVFALDGCGQDESGQWEGTTVPENEQAAAPAEFEPGVVAAYPIDSLAGVVDAAIVDFGETSADGNGSFLVTVEEPTTIRLFETGDVDVENALLTYRAKVKTGGLEGEAMLEMWCVFEEYGEFFSRGLDSTASGTTGWEDVAAVFRLEAGQNPVNIKLNLVITGPGTVWIDDISVTQSPLP